VAAKRHRFARGAGGRVFGLEVPVELERHQLDLRYEGLKCRSAVRERRLVASLAELGQQVPIVVVESGGEGRFVVIDGYKRIRALRRLGRDTVGALTWQLSESEALVVDRLMGQGPSDSAIEQGWLLRELHGRFELSLEELAQRFDRSRSWVSRRLGLVRELPEEIQHRVRSGELHAHAAMRYLLPLARANDEDALRFAAAIAGKGLSTRQVGELYQGYRSRSAKTRELVLCDPQLYLRTREECRRKPDATPLAPVDQLLRDFDMLGSIARRALRRLCEGQVVGGLAPTEWDEVGRCFDQARHDVERVGRQLNKERTDAGSGAADGDSRAAPTGPGQTDDRPGAGGLAGCGAQGDRVGFEHSAADRALLQGRVAPRADPRAAQELQGQPGTGA
jgi:ParB/RepB/Spo0J family partition protein